MPDPERVEAVHPLFQLGPVRDPEADVIQADMQAGAVLGSPDWVMI